jgi:hypothetical protein
VPHVGNLVPYYTGTGWAVAALAGQLSQTLSDTTKSPAATVAAKNYDIFFWMDSGTQRISRGPAWTSDTSRGTGAGTSEISRQDGRYVNTNAITNGPAALRGTYLGTVRTNAANANIDWSLGGSGAGGVLANLSVWNAYNRVRLGVTVTDASAAWAYATAAWRAGANNSATMRCNFVIGLQEDAWQATYSCDLGAAAGSTANIIGVGYDTTASVLFSAASASLAGGTAVHCQGVAPVQNLPAVGFHFYSGCELGASGATFGGANTTASLTIVGNG